MSVWLTILISRWLHIFIKRLLTSFTLLFKLSFRGTINEPCIVLVSFFRETANSTIELAIWLAVFSEFKSLVPTWSMTCSGSYSRIDGLTWSYMHLAFAEKNDVTLTKYLCLMFFVI